MQADKPKYVIAVPENLQLPSYIMKGNDEVEFTLDPAGCDYYLFLEIGAPDAPNYTPEKLATAGQRIAVIFDEMLVGNRHRRKRFEHVIAKTGYFVTGFDYCFVADSRQPIPPQIADFFGIPNEEVQEVNVDSEEFNQALMDVNPGTDERNGQDLLAGIRSTVDGHVISSSRQPPVQEDTFLDRLDKVKERKRMGALKKTLVITSAIIILMLGLMTYALSQVPKADELSLTSRTVTDTRDCAIMFPNGERVEGRREYSYSYHQRFGIRWLDATAISERTFLNVTTGGFTAVAQDIGGEYKTVTVDKGEFRQVELPNMPQYTFIRNGEIVVLPYKAFCR